MSQVATSAGPVEAPPSGAATPGLTPPTRADRRGAFLTDVIVEFGFADPQAVASAEEAARQLGKTPEQCLLENGAIDEFQLARARAERSGLDHVDLDVFAVDREAMQLIDRPMASRYTAVPIALAPDGALVVAFEDPYDMLGIDDIEVQSRSEVRPAVAAGSQIRALIEGLAEAVPAARKQAPPDLPEAPDDEEEQEEPPAVEVETPAEEQEVEEEELVVEEAAVESEPEPAPVSVPEGPPVAQWEPEPEPVVEPEPEPELKLVVEAEPHEGDGRLLAALEALQESTGEAIRIAAQTERQMGELRKSGGAAAEAEAALAEERARFDEERAQSEEREHDLRRELADALERIETLVQSQSEVRAAAEFALTATEKLAALSAALGPR